MSNTPTPTRAYRGRSSAMLVAIATITENALAQVDALQEADSTFTEAYFRDLRGRIDSVARTVLGADNAATLRNATLDLYAAVDSATRELGLTKTWIETRFSSNPGRRDELLNNLGFKRFYKEAVNRKQQEDLGQLLERVSAGFDARLTEEFVAAGLPQARVQAIHQLAATFNVKNVDQESQKGQRVQRTTTDIDALNAVYSEVMGLSKLARRLFRDRPAIQAGFTFDNVAPGPRPRKTEKPEEGQS